MKKNILFIVSLFCMLHCNSQTGTVEKVGDVLLYAMPISSITATLLIKDKKGTWQFTKGFLLNVAATEGLKAIVKKERPNGFDDRSFPSGHTAVTFQSAAFIQKRYGWKYGIPAYLLASYTGFSRIESKNHFFIDVVSGAIIGIGSSYLFTTKYTKDVTVSLLQDNTSTSVALQINF